MPKIIQLSTQVANMIAAGEVVERPASVVKELLENAVDAGATQITVELRSGGMTFLRVTDNGCGMQPEDARTAFLRHATSKLRTAEDLAAIQTMGFRGEALAAIASVSRIDLLTKTADSLLGYSLSLEAGTVTDSGEAGCPDGTTIIVRDLFFNTPARMKFMKSDTVEGSKVAAAVQLQALAHPDISFRLLRDGKPVLNTPGNGQLQAAVFCVYGKDAQQLAQVDSRWDECRLTGFVSKPTDARPSRSLQTFFVNGRPVKSRLLVTALEEAYRNQLLSGRYPSCVLYLQLPASAVDVNVHPAKTEVKFLNEKAVYDCVHYGVLGALNKTPDRPQVRFQPRPEPEKASSSPAPKPVQTTMTAQEFRAFSQALKEQPQPRPDAAAATVRAMEKPQSLQLRSDGAQWLVDQYRASPATSDAVDPPPEPDPEQQLLPLPEVPSYQVVGELFQSYVLAQQEDRIYLIDKHAAHERILFDNLRADPEAVSAQTLMQPVVLRLPSELCGILLANQELLVRLGFAIEEFGFDTLLVRQVPMELSVYDAKDTLETMAVDLQNGRRADPKSLRDQLLHTVACKAAIKAGSHSDPRELRVLVRRVLEDESLKHCPHGRPICIELTKKQLEKQFKRS